MKKRTQKPNGERGTAAARRWLAGRGHDFEACVLWRLLFFDVPESGLRDERPPDGLFCVRVEVCRRGCCGVCLLERTHNERRDARVTPAREVLASASKSGRECSFLQRDTLAAVPVGVCVVSCSV